jgi:hypothetical protein
MASAHSVGRRRCVPGSSPHQPAMPYTTTGDSRNHGRHAMLGMGLMAPGGPLWRWRAAGQAAQEKRGRGHWGALGRGPRVAGDCGCFEVACMRGRASPADDAARLNTSGSRTHIGRRRRHPQRQLSAAHERYRAAATGRRARHAALPTMYWDHTGGHHEVRSPSSGLGRHGRAAVSRNTTRPPSTSLGSCWTEHLQLPCYALSFPSMPSLGFCLILSCLTAHNGTV